MDGAARSSSLAPLNAAAAVADQAPSPKRSSRAGRKRRSSKKPSKPGKLNSLDAAADPGPRALPSVSVNAPDLAPSKRQSLNKHSVLGGLSGRPAPAAAPDGATAARADHAVAAAGGYSAGDSGLGSLSESPTAAAAAATPPAYSPRRPRGGGGDPPSRADRLDAARSGVSKQSGQAGASDGPAADGVCEALSSSSTMVPFSDGDDGGDGEEQFVPDEFLARSDTLITMSDQVQNVRLSERDRQRRNHQETMATRQRQREVKQAETITMHTRGHDVLETKIVSEKDRQLKAMHEKIRKRLEMMKKRRESGQSQAPPPE